MKVLSVSCCRVSFSALLEPHPCVHRKYQHPGLEVLFGVLQSAMLGRAQDRSAPEMCVLLVSLSWESQEHSFVSPKVSSQSELRSHFLSQQTGFSKQSKSGRWCLLIDYQQLTTTLLD
ncbi:hypothetical protein FKM82_019738 [Ascaphus truei]